DEPQPRTELPRAPAQAAALVEPHAVVFPRVGRIVQHAVHPLSRVRAEAGQHDEVDGGRREPKLGEQRVDRASRIAGIVLQSTEALFRRAGDDLAVTKDRRGGAVGLGDPEDDHWIEILSDGDRFLDGTRWRGLLSALRRRTHRGDGMKELIFAMEFTGTAGSVPGSDTRLQARTSATGQTL